MSLVTGFKQIMANLEKERRRIDRVTKRALREKGEQIGSDSDALAPVSSGKLVNSRKITATEDSVTIEYTAPYALEVHERTDVHHAVGEAKFLEKAVDKHRPTFTEDVGELALRNMK